MVEVAEADFVSVEDADGDREADIVRDDVRERALVLELVRVAVDDLE